MGRREPHNSPPLHGLLEFIPKCEMIKCDYTNEDFIRDRRGFVPIQMIVPSSLCLLHPLQTYHQSTRSQPVLSISFL